MTIMLFLRAIALLNCCRKAAASSTILILAFFRLFSGIAIISFTAIEARGQISVQDTLSTLELKKRSLEELMEMDITSVSKRAEPLFEAATAVPSSIDTEAELGRRAR